MPDRIERDAKGGPDNPLQAARDRGYQEQERVARGDPEFRAILRKMIVDRYIRPRLNRLLNVEPKEP